MNNTGGLLVECNPHELLAVNNVLLLKGDQHSDTLLQHFPEETLNAIGNHLKSKFAIQDMLMAKETEEALDRAMKVSWELFAIVSLSNGRPPI